MKKFTKTLSIVLLIAMCMSMFTIGAFADGEEVPHVCGTEKAYYEGSADELKIAAPGHALAHQAATAATCQTGGWVEHWICSTCNTVFSDAEGVNAIPASDVVLTSSHQKGTQHAAVAPTCTAIGYVEYYDCRFNCGAKLDASGNVITTITLTANGHSYNTNGICTVCGSRLSNFEVVGTTPAAFTADKNFVYDVTNPSLYTITGVSAGC